MSVQQGRTKTQPSKGAKRRGGFVQVETSLIQNRELSDAAHRLREHIQAKSWKTGTAKLSMPDLIELTGWCESKVRRARQELYDKRLLHFGVWKERRGPALGHIYRLLDPDDMEAEEVEEEGQEGEGSPSSVTPHPVTGDTPPCHQQQAPYEEGYEDLRDLEEEQIVCLSSTHLQVVATETTDESSPEEIEAPPEAIRILDTMPDVPGWEPDRAKDLKLLEDIAYGPGKDLDLWEMWRRFQDFIDDRNTSPEIRAHPERMWTGDRLRKALWVHFERCPTSVWGQMREVAG